MLEWNGMKIFKQGRPWYAEGLAFECARCGRCCAGPGEGYVWVTAEEIEAIAEFLAAEVEDVRRRFVRRVDRRHSLKEDRRSKDCVFLRYDEKGLSRCAIYPVRPTQCRTWPFWPGNLGSVADWGRAGLRCPGINRGPLHDVDEIERKRGLVNP